MDLKTEATVTTKVLKGKVVAKITRRRRDEVCIEFVDGSRLYVNRRGDNIQLLAQSPLKE